MNGRCSADLDFSYKVTINLDDPVMEYNIEMHSPAGMGQLIKYFESQSERLDKQTILPQSASLTSNFESMIKFNGVPILPPAMTASRREKVKQLKREAIFKEKRLRARQRRTNSKSEFPSLDSKDRPTARQLNFDSDLPTEENAASALHQRLGATNPLSTFATADLDGHGDDFGLHTVDSLSSDFVSLEEGTLPTVFSGHPLKSVKEQKISLNLDHLCKELKIQDLGSTSGSDLSDALQNTNTLDGDLIRGDRWAEKIRHQSPSSKGQTNSFCHDSQDTVVEVSPEAGSVTNQYADNMSSSGFVEKTDQSNLEQTQTSIGSSPGCGSTTIDSQKSKVHFASFILEYNTSASQSFESATVVKKKMSPDNAAGDESEIVSKTSHNMSHSNSHDSKQKSIPPNKAAENEGNSGLLNRVSFQPDSESSPGTPPFDETTSIPFKNYARNDVYNSDKENEEHRSVKVSPSQGGVKHESQTSPKETSEISRSRGHVARRQNVSDHHSTSRETRNQEYCGDNPQLRGISSYASAGVGPASSQASRASSHLVGSREASLSCDSSDLVSVSQISLQRIGGVLSMGKHSVSDSNASSKSGALTATSESSSSTLKEDLTPKESTDLGLNIIGTGSGSIDCGDKVHKDAGDINESADVDEEGSSSSTEEKNSEQKVDKTYMPEELSHSPKKLNVQPDTEENIKVTPQSPATTPPSKSHIRRGSYTLSEPSPVLIQAKSRLEAERKRKCDTNVDQSDQSKASVTHGQDGGSLKKKIDFDDMQPEATTISSVPSDPEKDGKAEHINRYLSQVQFQNSMNLHSQSLDHENDGNISNEDVPYQENASNSSVVDVLRSIADSTGSLGEMSDGELQSLQRQQKDLALKALIEQQRKDMEELFIQQRKEFLMFEKEIKLTQQQHVEQHEFLVKNAPENIKVKARSHKNEYSPESSGNFMETLKQGADKASSIKSNMNSLDNIRPQPFSRSSQNDSHAAFSLNLQQKIYHRNSGKTSFPGSLTGASSGSQSSQRHPGLNALALQEQTYVKTIDDDPVSLRQKQIMDPVGLANQIPEFNSPSAYSPRIHRPMMLKSPHLYSEIQRKARQVVVPPEALQPEMKPKFDRVSAVAKGFLTRCLLKSDKVQELIKTIKDTREFAFNFQTETPIKKGVFTSQDRSLLERIIAQLQAALLDVHEIFFEIPNTERMALIEHARLVDNDKKMKMSRDSTRSSGPRISQATLKALERKRKAREAEASAILSSTPRPKTAPSSNSPRCQNHTDTRALKPLQGQGHTSFHHHNTNSSTDKDRPRTAPEKQLTRPKRLTVQTSKPNQSSVISVSESTKETSKEGSKKATASSSVRIVAKSKVVPSKPSTGRPTKSWR